MKHVPVYDCNLLCKSDDRSIVGFKESLEMLAVFLGY